MFFRIILLLLLALLLLTLIRMFAGVLSKGLVGLFEQPNTGSAKRPSAPTGGELKRDPVCGTFVASESSVKQTIDGQIVHFCSVACRDKYHPA